MIGLTAVAEPAMEKYVFKELSSLEVATLFPNGTANDRAHAKTILDIFIQSDLAHGNPAQRDEFVARLKDVVARTPPSNNEGHSIRHLP